MIFQLNLSAARITQNEVTKDHFGLNHIFNFEQIGPIHWQTFDNIVTKVSPSILRYPGGAESERVFDMSNPDRDSYVTAAGVVKQLTPMTQFLNFATESGATTMITIPVTQLLSKSQPYGSRGFDDGAEQMLRTFIQHAIEAAGPNGIHGFELGNEYESFMTSREYGKVASSAAFIIQQELDKIYTENFSAQPDILVQVWSQNQQGSLTFQQMSDRNDEVLAQFDAAELSSIDGVVSHYYYRPGWDALLPTAHTLNNLSTSIDLSASLLRRWESASNRDLSLAFSEWNTFHEMTENFGARQGAALIEMFSGFVRSGVDVLNFYSAQYHATSLAAGNGQLLLAGKIFDLLQDNLIGFTVLEEQFDNADLGVEVFYKDGRLMLVLSSRIDTAQLFQFNFGLSDVRFSSVDRLFVDEKTADGRFKGIMGLDVYSDPDATFMLTNESAGQLIGPSDFNINLKPYEIAFYEFEVPADLFYRSKDIVVTGSDTDEYLLAFDGDDTLMGGNGNDTLEGGRGSDRLDGGAGVDFAQYDSLGGGAINIDLQNPALNLGDAAGDMFISIEGIIAGTGSDSLSGDRSSNIFFGASGDDLLIGRAGNDSLNGEDGQDTLQGGLGNDTLRGGGGKDTLWGDAGRDVLDGGDGIDTVFFSSTSTGLVVDLTNGARSRGEALGDIFVSIEKVVGTSASDAFYGNAADNIFEGRAGADLLSGGWGDDTLYAGDGADRLYGGDGNDFLVGGPGADYLSGGKGIDTAAFNTTATGSGISIDLLNSRNNRGEAAGDRYASIEIFAGTLSDDILSGDALANTFFGREGDDRLLGRAGNDTLVGGAGDDTITGGPGNDHLTGGVGSDEFVYVATADYAGELDWIADFVSGEDLLLISVASLPGVGRAGALSSEAFRSGVGAVSAQDDSDRLIYDRASGALYYDADGVGGTGAIQIIQLSPLTTLAVSDIVLF